MTKLGITRSATELADMMQNSASHGIRIIPLELTQTHSLNFQLPARDSLHGLDWLFFTSARGVRIFLRRLEESDMILSEKTKIAAVGGKTALALSQFGLSAAFTAQEVSGKGLFSEFLCAHENNRADALYISAKEPHFDPEQLFDGASINFTRLAVYETISAQNPPSSVAELGQDDYILFTAPSAVDAYQRFFGAPRSTAIALGKTTAMKISELGWPAPIIMAEPDISAVFPYLEQSQKQERQA